MLISLRQLLDDAAEYGYGVPAFNINNMEQGLAILKAADRVDAPVTEILRDGNRLYLVFLEDLPELLLRGPGIHGRIPGVVKIGYIIHVVHHLETHLPPLAVLPERRSKKQALLPIRATSRRSFR